MSLEKGLNMCLCGRYQYGVYDVLESPWKLSLEKIGHVHTTSNVHCQVNNGCPECSGRWCCSVGVDMHLYMIDR